MNNTKNLHLIEVKYLPATNYRGSRYKMTSERFGDSITKSYDYSLNSVQDMAVKWLKEHGQKIIGQCEGRKVDYIVLGAIDNSFTPLKEMV